ncbi:Na+/solute symporter [Aureobasidium pullulans]|nr:Na+/solute symporter [Aureobasidium pullulans]
MSTAFQQLSPGVGYGITIGLGAFFGVGMWLVSKLLARFFNEVQDAEMFMTAKHSVKSGLIASAVVSSWTIAATLLTSTSWTYSFGVGGAYFCAFCCVQIFLFSVAAIELKRKAPNAHTALELTRIRYGTAGHWIQISFSTLYQIINCSSILVGGSAVFHALTGMHPIAGCFLLPIGTVLYTLTGGIKATFLTDYIHTIILYFIVLTGLFLAYTTSDLIGSPDTMWELLKEAAVRSPNATNPGGEYLTLRNQDALMYGAVIFCGSFAAMVDVQLFQKAIAARPESTFNGYLIGSMSWFAIPFCLATTFGLVARALENNPVFPTYPNPMTAAEVGAGLVLPYAAYALFGSGGAVAVLLMTFMAATSAFSSDLVCFSSVFTFDIYRTYINPKATGHALIKVGHFAVVSFALLCSLIATGLTFTTVGVNFLVTFIGLVVNPATVPLAMTILWKQQNVYAVAGAPILSMCCALSTWIVTAYKLYGSISIGTLSTAEALLAGQVVALCSPMLFSPAISYMTGPQNFDWTKFQKIDLVDDSDVPDVNEEVLAQQQAIQLEETHISPEEDRVMVRARNIAALGGLGVLLCLCVLFPMPMVGTSYIFSKGFFRFWVVFTFLWAMISASIITLLPIWQGRRNLLRFAKFATGQKPVSTPVLHGEPRASASEERENINVSTEGHKSRGF